jgi:hypothetical protein
MSQYEGQMVHRVDNFEYLNKLLKEKGLPSLKYCANGSNRQMGEAPSTHIQSDRYVQKQTAMDEKKKKVGSMMIAKYLLRDGREQFAIVLGLEKSGIYADQYNILTDQSDQDNPFDSIGLGLTDEMELTDFHVSMGRRRDPELIVDNTMVWFGMLQKGIDRRHFKPKNKFSRVAFVRLDSLVEQKRNGNNNYIGVTIENELVVVSGLVALLIKRSVELNLIKCS